MKKIDKIDMFLFVCIVLGCVFSVVTTVAKWITGTESIWLNILTALLLQIPAVALSGWFSADILLKIINNHKEKKSKK